MKKTYDLLLTVLFCGFIGGVLVLSLLLPRKDFSELENRYLQQLPDFTLQEITSGSFMKDAEDYTADHIAGRDLWVALKSWCERLSGKQENNGVYFGKEETLINQVKDPKQEKLEKDAASVNKLVGNVNVPVYLGVIPTAAEIWKDRLPEGAPTADEKAWIDWIYDQSQAINVDMHGALQAHRHEGIYFRTDHHWSSLGAFYGANAILEAMGMEPLRLEDYEKTIASDSFNGTIFSSSGVRWLKPDVIETYIPEEGVQVTTYASGQPEEGELYVESFLEKKDKYSYFLGGNQPRCILRSEKNDGEKLLVIRDSYSDCLAPFLTERFSEVHLMDPRYDRNSISMYAEENGIDRVLVLYGFSNFVTDNNLFLLGM